MMDPQTKKNLGVNPAETVETLSLEAARQWIRQLQQHQLELEMQNQQLRRMQAEPAAAQERCVDLCDLAPVGDFTIGPKGLILEANLSAAVLLGVERSDLVRQPVSRFIAPEDRAIYNRHNEQALAADTPQECELRMLKTDGTPFWVVLRTAAIRCEDGTSVLRTAASDISGRKRTEETLLESEQKVRRLNEQILNMVMLLSHDIRAPLVSIGATLKLMLRGVYGKLDPSPANTVQDLLGRCSRLLGTAEDYLGKASVIGHSIDMQREVLDLRQDIIDPVLDELADDITKHGIVIDNQLGAIPAGSIAISANKTWLKAVYRNLFTNAVKYGGNGCTISFGFELRESHYLLNVYNSGRPIPEEDREKIFARFERIERSKGPSRDGAGLGLYLCREIIREHGGEIWYEALPEGANFLFTVSRQDTRDAS